MIPNREPPLFDIFCQTKALEFDQATYLIFVLQSMDTRIPCVIFWVL